MLFTQAYKAWLRKHGEEQPLPAVGLTNHQLFFVGFAQVQPLGRTPSKGRMPLEGVGAMPERCQGSVLKNVWCPEPMKVDLRTEEFSIGLYLKGKDCWLEWNGWGKSIDSLLLLRRNAEKETIAWECKMAC